MGYETARPGGKRPASSSSVLLACKRSCRAAAVLVQPKKPQCSQAERSSFCTVRKSGCLLIRGSEPALRDADGVLSKLFLFAATCFSFLEEDRSLFFFFSAAPRKKRMVKDKGERCATGFPCLRVSGFPLRGVADPCGGCEPDEDEGVLHG